MTHNGKHSCFPFSSTTVYCIILFSYKVLVHNHLTRKKKKIRRKAPQMKTTYNDRKWTERNSLCTWWWRAVFTSGTAVPQWLCQQNTSGTGRLSNKGWSALEDKAICTGGQSRQNQWPRFGPWPRLSSTSWPQYSFTKFWFWMAGFWHYLQRGVLLVILK